MAIKSGATDKIETKAKRIFRPALYVRSAVAGNTAPLVKEGAEYARSVFGVDPVATFADDGCVGFGLDREGLVALEGALVKCGIDAVLVSDLDRISRRHFERVLFVERLTALGVELYTVCDGKVEPTRVGMIGGRASSLFDAGLCLAGDARRRNKCRPHQIRR